ncbi:MAG: hypothetical protein JSR59_16980 [Proteobacteria bacterium]|nr:hypothetical protein [Pseudomonadota bacterium]
MLATRMKSQPCYPPMEWDRSDRQHIVFAAGADDALAWRLYGCLPVGSLTVVCETPSGAEPDAWQREAPPGLRLLIAGDRDAALQQLDAVPAAADMGARLYAIGDERAIRQAMQVADRHGLRPESARLHRVPATLPSPLAEYKGPVRYQPLAVQWLAAHDDGSVSSPGPQPE